MMGGNLPYFLNFIIPLIVVHIIVNFRTILRVERVSYLGDNINMKSVLDDTGPVQTGGQLYMFLANRNRSFNKK